METLRQTMVKSNIADLVDGSFVKMEGFDPSYVVTHIGKVSRTKILGTVTSMFMSEDGNYSNITIEDDSSSIRVKAFGEDSDIFEDIEAGDIAMVIGKVKEYNGEIYISPEIIKKRDVSFENLHKLEVLRNRIKKKDVLDLVKKEMDNFADLEEMKKYLIKKHKMDEADLNGVMEKMSKAEEVKEKDYKPFLLDLMEKLDEDDGVETKKLLKESKLGKDIFGEVMNELINEGLCYEPKPGFVKRV